jgi:type VI secretion system protein ImpA
LNFTPLRKLFEQAAFAVQSRLIDRGDGGSISPLGQEGSEGVPQGVGAGAGPKRLSGEITSRDDVIKAMDKIGEYYKRNEPSSPVPLLLERCKRLVHKDFMDIIRDMAPEGLAQVELLRGPIPEEEDGYS